MGEITIRSRKELRTWVYSMPECSLVKNVLEIKGLVRFAITLEKIFGLSINVIDKNQGINIILNEGRYRVIRIGQGNNISLTKVKSVELLTCNGNCKIFWSNINICEASRYLQIECGNIKTLKHSKGGIKIDNSSKIDSLECDHSKIIKLVIKDLTFLEMNNVTLDEIPVFSISFVKKSYEKIFGFIPFAFKKRSNFLLMDSEMDKAKFINCDFSNTILYCHNSNFKIEEYRNVKWFQTIRKLKADWRKTKLLSRDECRDLKLVAHKLENSIDESYFRALELIAHSQELKLFSRNFDSKITLFLNRISNRFERSWLIPLIWILVFGIVMFYFTLNFSKLGPIDFKDYYNEFKFFWIFLNPIHDFDFLGDDKSTSCSVFLDTIHRIFNSYFIYQLVAAFRKFKVA